MRSNITKLDFLALWIIVYSLMGIIVLLTAVISADLTECYGKL